MKTELLAQESVELMQPAILASAQRSGVRALVIKGRTLSDQGLRKARTSSDVDVLIDPRDFERFTSELLAHGWDDRDEAVLAPLSDRVTAVAPHSLTLLHPSFPTAVDAHRYYPGFLASPQEVFEALWERKTTNQIAHVVCATLDPVDHWILAMLHMQRSPDRPQLDQLRAWLDARTSSERKAIASRAVDLGASEPLRGELARVGVTVPPPPPALRAALREWEIVVSGSAHGDLTFASELANSPRGTRLRLVWHAFFPPEQTFRIFNEIPPGKGALYWAYTKRILRALTRIPRMVRYWRRR